MWVILNGTQGWGQAVLKAVNEKEDLMHLHKIGQKRNPEQALYFSVKAHLNERRSVS